MKYFIPIMVILLMVSTSFVGVSYNLEKSSTIAYNGNILYVGGSGPGNYTKIQDAVNDSSNGDTVFVYEDSSPYHESILVEVSITIRGEDKNTTIIEGIGEKQYVVYLSSPYVVLTGFTIENADGIYVGNNPYFNSYNNIICNNIIKTKSSIGIALDSTHSNHIYRNNISNCKWGIIGTEDCSNNTISQNNFMKNRYYGIYFYKGLEDYPSNNYIYYNNFFSNYNHVEDDGLDNQWDNGEEGNYWHNYKGEDNDGDGIGDEPYWISKSKDIKDNYPLMEPFGNITSFNKNINRFNQRLIIRWIDCLLERFPLLGKGLGFILHPAKEPYDIGV